MMAKLAAAIRWLPGYLHRARSDSLVRNSLYQIGRASCRERV